MLMIYLSHMVKTLINTSGLMQLVIPVILVVVHVKSPLHLMYFVEMHAIKSVNELVKTSNLF